MMQCTMQTTARNLLSAVIADRLAEQGHVDLPQCVSSPESKPSRLSRLLVRVCRLALRLHDHQCFTLVGGKNRLAKL